MMWFKPVRGGLVAWIVMVIAALGIGTVAVPALISSRSDVLVVIGGLAFGAALWVLTSASWGVIAWAMSKEPKAEPVPGLKFEAMKPNKKKRKK